MVAGRAGWIDGVLQGVVVAEGARSAPKGCALDHSEYRAVPASRGGQAGRYGTCCGRELVRELKTAGVCTCETLGAPCWTCRLVNAEEALLGVLRDSSCSASVYRAWLRASSPPSLTQAPRAKKAAGGLAGFCRVDRAKRAPKGPRIPVPPRYALMSVGRRRSARLSASVKRTMTVCNVIRDYAIPVRAPPL